MLVRFTAVLVACLLWLLLAVSIAAALVDRHAVCTVLGPFGRAASGALGCRTAVGRVLSAVCGAVDGRAAVGAFALGPDGRVLSAAGGAIDSRAAVDAVALVPMLVPCGRIALVHCGWACCGRVLTALVHCGRFFAALVHCGRVFEC